MRAARRKPNLGTAQLVLLLAAGCSLQDFDYLQKGTGGASSGGTGGASSAGTSSVAGSETSEGGEGAGPSGGKGGSEPTGGSKAGGGSGGGGKGGSGGTGPTGELENGSFETGSLTGWTLETTDQSERFAFVQVPTSGATVPDGGYEFSTWHKDKAFSVDLHQTIKGLEDGTYVFKGYFNLDSGLITNMYVKDCGGEDPEPVAVISAGASAWSPVLIEGIEVKGGSCTVGLSIESTPPHWLNADLFTFELDPNAGGEGGAGGAPGAGGAN